MDLRRNVLVVGGAGGIGAACCAALASAWNPIVADRDEEAAQRVAAETGGVLIGSMSATSTALSRASRPSSVNAATSTGSCSRPA